VRNIELSTWESVPHKLNSLKKSLENIYEVKLDTCSLDIPLDKLYPTEDFLENDKLALVFMKIIEEDYDVPIISVERGSDYFVLDGHHRAYISSKIQRKNIKSLVLTFPEGATYRNVLKSSLASMPIKEVEPIQDPIVLGWSRLLKILKQYEALCHMQFYMRRENPPQEPVAHGTRTSEEPDRGNNQTARANSLHKIRDRYYVLDGHARCLRAKQLGLRSIEAIILLPQIPVHFGIVKTTREMKLCRLEDIHIL